MRFEDEIKQTKPFKNNLTKALLNVIYTGNYLQDITSCNLKEFDINGQHYNILRILKGVYPNSVCPGHIKEILLDKRGDLTRLLDKLEKMKYITRNLNPGNRRMIEVRITKEGLKLLEAISNKPDKEDVLKGKLTDKEAVLLSDLLDKIRG